MACITGKLPPDCQDAADAILVAAAKAGVDLRGLAGLAAEMYARSLPAPDPNDDDPDETFEDRQVRVETTFAGAGVISGDLTPECAAVVTAVLEIEWITEMRIRWAARRAEAADGAGSDGAAWLDGDAARAEACDATITPVVTVARAG